MGLEFEWHDSKAKANLQKHEVDFKEAATIFSDANELMIRDPDHSLEEERFVSVGRSVAGRLLVVSYTEVGNRVRIISARRAAVKEREQYETQSEI